MAKKLVIGIVSVVVLGVLFVGPRFFGYMGTIWTTAQTKVQESVPFALELAELKKYEKDYDSQIKAIKKAEAKLEVEIEDRVDQIAETEKSLQKQKNQNQQFAKYLKAAGDSQFVSTDGESQIDRTQFETDLTKRFTKYTKEKTTLVKVKQTQTSQQKQLESLRDKRENLEEEKSQLLADIAELEASQAALEAQKSAGTSDEFDGSLKTKYQDRLKELRKRQRVEEKLLEDDQVGDSLDNLPIKTTSGSQGSIADKILSEDEEL